MSLQEEIDLGDDLAAEINRQLPLIEDRAANRYFNDLGQRIARSADRREPIRYRFYLVNSDVVNAFAIPGGHVYMNRGLIERAETMSEVAAVTAHEIGHVVGRHGAKQLARLQTANLAFAVGSVLLGQPTGVERAAIEIGAGAVFARYSRDQEREADSLGVHFLIRAGIDPAGMPAMFQTLLEERERRPSALEQFFSTHPLTEERVERARSIQAALPDADAPGLQRDTRKFHEFQRGLAELPPPPDRERRE